MPFILLLTAIAFNPQSSSGSSVPRGDGRPARPSRSPSSLRARSETSGSASIGNTSSTGFCCWPFRDQPRGRHDRRRPVLVSRGPKPRPQARRPAGCVGRRGYARITNNTQTTTRARGLFCRWVFRPSIGPERRGLRFERHGFPEGGEYVRERADVPERTLVQTRSFKMRTMGKIHGSRMERTRSNRSSGHSFAGARVHRPR